MSVLEEKRSAHATVLVVHSGAPNLAFNTEYQTEYQISILQLLPISRQVGYPCHENIEQNNY